MIATTWRRLRARRRHHPELGPLLLVVAAWVVLLGTGHLGPGHGGEVAGAAPTDPLVGAHVHHVAGGGQAHAADRTEVSSVAWLAAWGAMVVAMMVPAALPAARHVGLNSLRRRRQRAIATFLLPYVALWVAVGVVALAVLRVLGDRAASWAAVGAAVAAAVGWQLLPYKRRARLSGHRTVRLPASGWPATAGCARFGLRFGTRCVAACWPLMAVMALTLHRGVGWMVALTAVVVIEAYEPWLHPTVRAWARGVRRRCYVPTSTSASISG